MVLGPTAGFIEGLHVGCCPTKVCHHAEHYEPGRPASKPAKRAFTAPPAGEEYLQTLATPPWTTWTQGYEAYRRGDLTVAEQVALAHPQQRVLPDQEAIQGPRQFSFRDAAGRQRCRAELVWGIACTIDADRLEADHRFPYSHGGPTIAANRLVLCPVHNSSKSNDVHTYTWETGVPRWLASVLERIAVRAA